MRNPSEILQTTVLHGGPSALPAALTCGTDDQAQQERESVFKRLQYRETYAAATAATGRSFNTNDILIQDSPMQPMRIGAISSPSQYQMIFTSNNWLSFVSL